MLSEHRRGRLTIGGVDEHAVSEALDARCPWHQQGNRPFLILVLGEPQRDPTGQVVGVKGIAIDLSRRKLKVKTRS